MDKNLSEVKNVAKKTVIELGQLGTFDEHGIFPINPCRDGDRIVAYTCGWNRRISVPVETAIGLVESFDNGETFVRLGHGPVLGASLKEPVLVGDGFVKKYDNSYYMWYIFGTKWIKQTPDEPQARVYKIGYAISNDGSNWKKHDGVQIIKDVLNEDECQALPSVTKIGNRFHMYFCFREATDFRKNPNRGYKLGYAFSDDLINWVRDDSQSGISNEENEWDTEMKCYPHIFEVEGKVFLLYNGNEFGKSGFGLAELLTTE
ncbi:MAG: hypothetical protein ABIX01_13250 [Chitinophagaceae bacterium]